MNVGRLVAYAVTVSATDREELETLVRRGSTPQKRVLRSLIVLLAADGQTNAAIAAVKAWACQMPTEQNLPIARWSTPRTRRPVGRRRDQAVGLDGPQVVNGDARKPGSTGHGSRFALHRPT